MSDLAMMMMMCGSALVRGLWRTENQRTRELENWPRQHSQKGPSALHHRIHSDDDDAGAGGGNGGYDDDVEAGDDGGDDNSGDDAQSAGSFHSTPTTEFSLGG